MKQIQVLEGKVVAPQGMKVGIVASRFNEIIVNKLLGAYPGLADSYVKLATFIYMGLDNNRIARLLVIRPESVKQARWRLRRMMNLDKDTSLDDAIRALGSD